MFEAGTTADVAVIRVRSAAKGDLKWSVCAQKAFCDDILLGRVGNRFPCLAKRAEQEDQGLNPSRPATCMRARSDFPQVGFQLATQHCAFGELDCHFFCYRSVGQS